MNSRKSVFDLLRKIENPKTKKNYFDYPSGYIEDDTINGLLNLHYNRRILYSLKYEKKETTAQDLLILIEKLTDENHKRLIKIIKGLNKKELEDVALKLVYGLSVFLEES